MSYFDGGSKFKNKKTKDVYTVLYQAIDATNERDGNSVVVYQSKGGMVFVRDQEEFYEKFESIK